LIRSLLCPTSRSSSFFSLMSPPPPPSPLFPYTTLFRSPSGRGRVRVDRPARAPGHLHGGIRLGDHGDGARVRTRLGARRRDREQDRKSTRLNSSHDQISYAVFCLKKKKQRRTHTTEERD